MTIRARYAGRCYKCGGAIQPGQEIEWDKATRRTAHTTCPQVEAPKQEQAEAQNGLRIMAARYPGQCPACGEEIRTGAEIVYDRQTRRAYHVRCQDRATEPAPYKISGGSGYGYTGWRPGQVLVTSERQQKEYKFPEFLTVIRAGAEYVREDGMSFGVGDEQGYVYWAECREATEEEAATARERLAAQERKAKAKARVKEIARQIQETGERPDGRHVPEGERLFDTQNLYGGGDWFVVGPQWIWYVLNNGHDGDDWSRNNVITHGAGAIGWRVPATDRLAQELRSLSEVLIPAKRRARE